MEQVTAGRQRQPVTITKGRQFLYYQRHPNTAPTNLRHFISHPRTSSLSVLPHPPSLTHYSSHLQSRNEKGFHSSMFIKSSPCYTSFKSFQLSKPSQWLQNWYCLSGSPPFLNFLGHYYVCISVRLSVCLFAVCPFRCLCFTEKLILFDVFYLFLVARV